MTCITDVPKVVVWPTQTHLVRYCAYILYRLYLARVVELRRNTNVVYCMTFKSLKEVPDGETPSVPRAVSGAWCRNSAYVIPLTTTTHRRHISSGPGPTTSQSFHSISAVIASSGMEAKFFRILTVKTLFLLTKKKGRGFICTTCMYLCLWVTILMKPKEGMRNATRNIVFHQCGVRTTCMLRNQSVY